MRKIDGGVANLTSNIFMAGPARIFWWVANWAIKFYRCSTTGVFSIVSTKFHVDRERRFFYEFSMEKLAFLSFRGYVSRPDRVGKKQTNEKNSVLLIYQYLFFCMCSVVSGPVCIQFSSPNSQKRWCCAYESLGNIVRFLTGPARTCSALLQSEKGSSAASVSKDVGRQHFHPLTDSVKAMPWQTALTAKNRGHDRKIPAFEKRLTILL